MFDLDAYHSDNQLEGLFAEQNAQAKTCTICENNGEECDFDEESGQCHRGGGQK